MNRLSVLITLLAFFLTFSLANAKKFAAVDLVGNGVNSGQNRLVSNLLRTRILSESKGDAVPPAMMSQALKKNNIENKSSIDAAYFKTIGDALGVNQVIGGTMSLSNGTFSIDIQIYNVSKNQIIGTISETTTNGFGDVMQTLIPKIAKKIISGDFTSMQQEVAKDTPTEEVAQPVKEDPKVEATPKVEEKTTFDLNIISNPMGAILAINGKDQGPTPIQISLEKGMYQLTLKADGYETLNQQMLIDGKQTDFAFELNQTKTEVAKTPSTDNKELVETKVKEGAPATVVIGTQPMGAEVSMDGKYIGVSNLLYQTVSGNHTFSFKLNDYKDTSLVIPISGEENNIIELPLTPSVVAANFKDVAEGNNTMKFVKISLGLATAGLMAGGYAMDNSIKSLNKTYQDPGTSAEKVNSLHNDIDSKSKIRNTLYIASLVSAIGFSVTFFIP